MNQTIRIEGLKKIPQDKLMLLTKKLVDDGLKLMCCCECDEFMVKAFHGFYCSRYGETVDPYDFCFYFPED